MDAVLISDDPITVEMARLSLRLRWPDITPTVATTAAEGLEWIERESPDVVLIHPSFSDMPMAKAIQDLRGFSQVPMLVLGGDGSEVELISALESGADDYVRQPWELTEMMARVWALLRRTRANHRQRFERPLHSGPLLLHPLTYEVYLGDRRVVLTSTEFRLLHLLLKNRGNVVSHQTLEHELWGDGVDGSGLVKKYVQRLRRKLGDKAREPSWIASIHGTGYRFVGPGEPSEGVLVGAD